MIDLKARAKAMQEAEAMAMADQPLVPIYYYVSKNLISTKVKGWTANTKDIHRTRWLSIS
jgi:oligopeptide transport system substrate-binding protein